MKTISNLLLVSALASCAIPAYAQEAPRIAVIPGVAAAQASVGSVPSWQAVCGYKWRQYRAATGASGRDAYYAFMRTPSSEGGCGAGETTRVRPVQVKPADDKIREWLDAHPAESKSVAPIGLRSDASDDLPTTWQDARGRKK